MFAMEHLIWMYGLARRRERARAKPRRGRKREDRRWTGKVAIVLMVKLGCHAMVLMARLLPSRCAALCTSTVTSTKAGPSSSRLKCMFLSISECTPEEVNTSCIKIKLIIRTSRGYGR